MSNDVALELEELCGLSNADLRAAWIEAFGRDPPARVSPDFLRRSLAYRRQEVALGGLPRGLERRLAGLAATFERDPSFRPRTCPVYKPGTRLVRRWRDETHEVEILTQGYAYRGETYDSLSKIARVITGTRWSGPVFFGLRASS